MRILGALAILVTLLFVAAAPVAAQQPSPPADAQADAAEHEALRQVGALYERVIREGRPELLAPHLASDFHGVMATGRVVKSLGDLEAYWTEIRGFIGEGGTYTTTLHNELSVILDDVALARGTTDDVIVTSDGEEFRFTTFWTATLRKEDGAWKIRQLQGTMDPIGNAFVRAFSKRAMMIAAGFAGVIGIVLGAALMVFASGRRRKRGKPQVIQGRRSRP